MLTEAEKKVARLDGFLLARGVLDGCMMQELHEAVEGVLAVLPLSNGYRTVFDLAGRAPSVMNIVRARRITELVTCFVGKDVAFLHSKLHVGVSPVGWHRDACSYPHTNSSVVAVSLYLDGVRGTDGGLQVVPGSHRRDLVPAELTLGSEISWSHDNSVGLSIEPGDVLVHNCLLIHRPAERSCGKRRRVVLFVYRSADAALLVPNTFGDECSGEVVSGEAAERIRVEESSTIFATECVDSAGKLVRERRHEGLRIRGQRIGML